MNEFRLRSLFNFSYSKLNPSITSIKLQIKIMYFYFASKLDAK